MKNLRWPWLWLGLWLLLVIATVVVSLGPPASGPDIPASDKWMHGLTYGSLAVVAVQIFRRGRPLLCVALALVLLGAGLEVAQGTLTSDRMMDWHDALANTIGVGLGCASAWLPVRDLLVRLVPARRTLAP
ncbi:MAG: hypothetical protein L0H31_07060 [Nocardioidaceae bacterium]|nr:hypothetical protein [Nocardioidaceae bacterium]